MQIVDGRGVQSNPDTGGGGGPNQGKLAEVIIEHFQTDLDHSVVIFVSLCFVSLVICK